MDLQAAASQGSDPLISPDEVASSLAGIKNVNDGDFDPNTTKPLTDREGLTNSTFSIVTYLAQFPGRFFDFSLHDDNHKPDVTGQGRQATNAMELAEIRQQHVRSFEQKALSLLHFCDPESSPLAWFTW